MSNGVQGRAGPPSLLSEETIGEWAGAGDRCRSREEENQNPVQVLRKSDARQDNAGRRCKHIRKPSGNHKEQVLLVKCYYKLVLYRIANKKLWILLAMRTIFLI